VETENFYTLQETLRREAIRNLERHTTQITS
jgi:hypothetical protein